MTKKVDTWMPLLVDKYLGDTTHLTTEQHGAYLLILMAMWKGDGSLSNSDARLAAIARLTPARWKAHREVLLEFFSSDGESIAQKRLSEELERAKKSTDAKAKAGAEGAKKRWGNDGTANGSAMADPLANGYRTDASIPTPTHSPSESLNTSNLTVAPAFPEKAASADLLGDEPETGPKAGVPDCPHKAVLALWAEVMPDLPQHLKWTETRAAHLRARWRETAVERAWPDTEAGLAYLRKLFLFVRRSDFLMGKSRSTDPNRKPFVIELEWLLKPANWAKTIEGKYHEQG